MDLVFCGHSHGPAIHSISTTGVVGTTRLDLEDGAIVRVKMKNGQRYVIDAGSLGRPGHHPEPGRFDRATYAALDVASSTLELRCLAKRR